MAIRNNPNVSVARLIALAEGQVVREARAAELPMATGNLTGVDAHENSRITAGLLNNPTVYNRAAGGLNVSQLITDFGRTHNLVLSAESTAKAQMESARATQLDITLTVDQAFYQALTAQAMLKVARKRSTNARRRPIRLAPWPKPRFAPISTAALPMFSPRRLRSYCSMPRIASRQPWPL